MHFVAVGDIHGNLHFCKKVGELCKERHIRHVICTGDFTTHGSKDRTLEVLKSFGNVRIFGVPGNMDTNEVLEVLEEKGVSLHGKRTHIEGFVLAGFGGGLFGSAGHINNQENKIEQTLENLLEEDAGHEIILVTHLPPYNTKLDDVGNEIHVGSKAIRNIIEKFDPLLHLCGHIHEAAGEDFVYKTKCINIGPLEEGNVVIVQTDRLPEIERIKLV